MANLGPALGSISVIVLIIGMILFFAVRAKRSLAKKLLLGGGVAFIVAIIITPTPPPAIPRKSVAPDAATPRAERAVSSPVAVAGSSMLTVDPKPAFIARYQSMLGFAKPCDQSIGKVAAAAGKGDVIEMYSEAKAGQAVCKNAWSAIGKIEPDETMPADARSKEAKAIATCRQSYFLRQRAMETAMKVADGDGRASNVVSFRDDLKTGQLGLLLCVGEWMSAGSSIGIKAEDLK